MLPEEDGRVDSASYAVAMVVRPIYVRYVLLFFFGIWKHVSAPNSDSYGPTSEVQIQTQEADFWPPGTTTAGSETTHLTNFSWFVTVWWFFFLAFWKFCRRFERKISRGFLPKFRICSIFSGVFCRHLSWKQTCENHRKPNAMEQFIRELLKPALGSRVFLLD